MKISQSLIKDVRDYLDQKLCGNVLKSKWVDKDFPGSGWTEQFSLPNVLLPTPAASDNRDRGGPKDPAVQRRLEIGKQVGLTMMVDGQLNPRFVAEMMGFPPNWLELPFQSIEMNPSKPTETP